MTYLYAYDFDGTLIPYDSLNRFLRKLLLKEPIIVGWIILLRVLRFISSTEMKSRVNNLVQNSSRLTAFAQDFAESVSNDVIWPTVTMQMPCVSIILSASPVCYMQYVRDKLGCAVIASSQGEDGIFINMYGEEKLNHLNSHFPKHQYIWKYAASDSDSDKCWIEKFEQFDKITL